MKKTTLFLLAAAIVSACNSNPKNKFATIIRNGTIYDGNGGAPYQSDVAINADTIAFIGDLKNATADTITAAKRNKVVFFIIINFKT